MASSNPYDSTFDEDVLQNDHNTCPECSGRVTTNTHETVCDECGLVLTDDHIDPGPEWCDYGDDDSASRVGAPRSPTRHDDGLSTEIGWKTDGKGNQLDGATQRRLHRLRKQHTRARIPTRVARNRMEANTEIQRLCGPGALDLPRSLCEQACALFRSAHDADLVQGRSLEAMAAASVYAVCRVNGLPRTIEEVASHSSLPAGKVRHSYGVLNAELGLPVEPLDPRAYVAPLASELGLSPDIQQRARTLLERAVEAGLGNGCNPAGLAAAALYHVQPGTVCTQTTLANAANVSPPTLRKRWYELRALEES